MDWLTGVTDRVAEAHGLDARSLHLASGDARTILDLARIASHASGNRTNAPLLCFVLGTARAQGTPLDDLAATIRSVAGDPDAEARA